MIFRKEFSIFVPMPLPLKRSVFSVMLLLFSSFLLFASFSSPVQAALVPCGLSQDDPTTPIYEDDPCTVCHVVIGGKGIIDYALQIMTFVAIAVIVAMAILYIVSAGNEQRIQLAKTGLKASLVGFAVILGAWLIVNLILGVLTNGTVPGLEKSDGAFTFTCDPNSTSEAARRNRIARQQAPLTETQRVTLIQRLKRFISRLERTEPVPAPAPQPAPTPSPQPTPTPAPVPSPAPALIPVEAPTPQSVPLRIPVPAPPSEPSSTPLPGSDTIAPTVTLSSPFPVTNQNPTFAFTATDTGSGLRSVDCSLDGSDFALCTTATYQTYQDLSLGRHSFRLRATDKVGKVSRISIHNWSVVEGGPETPTPTPPTPPASPSVRDAYAPLQAESFDGMEGVVTNPDVAPNVFAPQSVGYLDDGDWMRYNDVDFGTDGARSARLTLAVPSESAGKQIEIRFDSLSTSPAGVLTLQSTGDWLTYTEQKMSLEHVTGKHSVFLLMKGASRIANLDSFVFSKDPIVPIQMPTPTPAPQPTPQPGASFDATNWIEAESYSAEQGTTRFDDNGIAFMGAADTGDFLKYEKVNFGQTPLRGFTAKLAADPNYAGKNIEIRLDSPTGIVLGIYTLPPTGSWTTFTEQSFPVAEVSGIRDLYFTFTGGEHVLNIDKFVFTQSAPVPTPTPSPVPSPTPVPYPTPSQSGAVLPWDDPRVRFWTRTDMTNQEIGNKFPWTGVQGAASDCNYEVLQNLPEPSTNLDPATGQQRVVLARNGGWFQHRIWEGMCHWTGSGSDGTQRLRSSYHTSGDATRAANSSDIWDGHGYWIATGGKFYPDMFSQTDPSDDRTTIFVDFHHWGGGSALSGQVPWACGTSNTGYTCRFLWNKADSGVSSPTGEVHWDGAQRVTMINDTSKDTSKPHFFAWRIQLDWDWNAPVKPYVEMYRQIGVDGPIKRIGRWDVPNNYREPTMFLYPKFGLHQWYSDLSGQPTRSLDMPGVLIVRDTSVTPETIFRSLTVALPRSGSTPSPVPTPVPAPQPAPSFDATNWIEAEAYSVEQGMSPFQDASTNFMGAADTGDFLKYERVNFGSTVKRGFTAKLAAHPSYAGKQLEIRLDSPTGTVLGIYTLPSTGSWTTFTEQSLPIAEVSGIRDLYFTFSGGEHVLNIDSFKFTQSAPVVPIPTPSPTPTPSTGSFNPYPVNDEMAALVRTDFTNIQIGQFRPYMGAQAGRDVNIETLPDNHFWPDPNNGGAPRLILGRGAAGSSDQGKFLHRIWDGQQLWTEGDGSSPRQRSVIRNGGDPANRNAIKYRTYYHYAFGVEFFEDQFAQQDPSPDHMTQFWEFHHKGGAPTNTGRVPWYGYTNQTEAFIDVTWFPGISGLSTSPTGHTADSGRLAARLWEASKASVVGKLVNFDLEFYTEWDYNAAVKPYVRLHYQIGLDGPIISGPRYEVPTTYREDATDHALDWMLGLHQWHATLDGPVKHRSMNSPGVVIFDSAAPQDRDIKRIFDTLTAAMPRGGATSSPTPPPTPQPTPSFDATNWIEAESYSAEQGTARFDDSGVTFIGAADTGDFLKYERVNFGSTVKRGFTAKLAAHPSYAGKQLEIRLDSPTGVVLGIYTLPSTGSWTTFTEQSLPIAEVSGVRDLYFTFAGGEHVLNIDSFKFTQSAPAPSPAPSPTPVPYPTPGQSGAVLPWDDPRLRWWIRADKTNQEIDTRFTSPGQQFSWTGVQGASTNCQYEVLARVPEPNTNLDPATGQQRVVFARSNGWFQHRIWNGMCLWTDGSGGRMRSSLHTSDNPATSITPALVGHEYWFAFGGKFYPDMFTQAIPDEDVQSVQILDFHHSGGTALSGQTPWAMHVDGTGYWFRTLWNQNDSGIASPTGEVHWDGAQRITMIRDTSKDTVNPHFFAFKFRLGPDASAYTELYRQIGVDGPIEKIGRWNAPNSYAHDPFDSLFPKYGIHRWFPNLNGQGAPTRSIDMAGALLVEDVSIPVETIFRSLAVALPRSGSTPSPVPTPVPAPTSAPSFTATNWIEAESYSAEQGTTRFEENGATFMGAADSGDFLKYEKVNFGQTPLRGFTANLAAHPNYAGKQLEIRLDSPTGVVLGIYTIPSTGSWTTFTDQSLPIAEVSGVRDLYFTFSGGEHVLNINGFKFTQSAPTPAPAPVSTTGRILSTNFGPGVSLYNERSYTNGDEFAITGTDQSTNYVFGPDAPSIWGGRSTYRGYAAQFMKASQPGGNPSQTHTLEFLSNISGPSGSPTNVLHHAYKIPFECCAQSPYMLYPDTNRPQGMYYERYWLKLLPGFVNSWGSGWRWYMLNETKNADDNNRSGISLVLDNGKPRIRMTIDNMRGGNLGGQPVPQWGYLYPEQLGPHLDEGVWYKVELAMKPSNGSDGFVWAAINGQQFAFQQGQNIFDGGTPKYDRIFLTGAYANTANPGLDTYITSLELWDRWPSDASAHPNVQ